MKNPNRPNSEPGKESLAHLFKTQKLTVSLFSILVLAVMSLGFWQIKINVLNPFKPPVGGFEEVDLNTVLALDPDIDTDGDGLSDYDEINIYGTSPYLEDTDSDGISDYDEVMRGSDPLCPEGKSCLGSGDYFSDTNLIPTSTEMMLGDSIGLDDADISKFEDMVLSSISALELRGLLIENGADIEILDQISDEDLLASFQEEILNNQNEQQ